MLSPIEPSIYVPRISLHSLLTTAHPIIIWRPRTISRRWRKSLHNEIRKMRSSLFLSTCHFNTSNATTFDFQGEIQKQTIYLVIIGCIIIVLGYIQVAFWSMAGERQTKAIRKHLFQSILRKEMVYFDTHKTGELNTKLSDDVNKIHDGIGDKLGSATQFTSSFLTGLIIGRWMMINPAENDALFFRFRQRMETHTGHSRLISASVHCSCPVLQSRCL